MESVQGGMRGWDDSCVTPPPSTTTTTTTTPYPTTQRPSQCKSRAVRDAADRTLRRPGDKYVANVNGRNRHHCHGEFRHPAVT